MTGGTHSLDHGPALEGARRQGRESSRCREAHSAACTRRRPSCRWPLLSAAWTASLAGVRRRTASADASARDDAARRHQRARPQAIEAPASVSAARRCVAPACTATPGGSSPRASTYGIPPAALAAYQRAETVINAADKGCNLAWQLIAAIGRVESDHGRADGNTLDAEGVATPGIYGIAARRHATAPAEIADTDAGQYDDDATFDRAVGPMQFIPSTWSVVGVDADGDGKRNPQDIDDAALGDRRLPLLRRRRPRRPTPASAPRSTATTTARRTSTWCSRS